MEEKCDITDLPLSEKKQIAKYIAEDTLKIVNSSIDIVSPPNTLYVKYFKRFFDLLFGLIGFVKTLPINLIIAVITIYDVGMPIFFEQIRLGKDKKPFKIYKFRNMTNDRDKKGELLPPYARVTKWGRFVRRSSLDELLNFIPVIKGDMSIIGPRPLLDYYADRLNDRHRSIYLIKPGLECPFVKDVDHPLRWDERLDNYVWYVEHCSFLVDIQLSFRLVKSVFDRRSMKIREKADHGGLLGYDTDGHIISTKAVPYKYIVKLCNENGYANLEDAVSKRKESVLQQ